METTAALYVRISKDATGEGAGVARQQADARDLAARRGWTVGAVFEDNDISASGSKVRPGFEALLKAIEAGQVRIVIAWSLDRINLSRSRALRVIEAGRDHGVTLALVRGSDLDLSTPAGRLTADVLASVAQNEIEVKSERQKRANRERATQGKHFGTRRCFGYELDGVTIRPDEARALRDGFAYIEGGGSLRQLAKVWNAAGLRGPQSGAEWSGATVSRTLRLPRLAGMRTYHGEIVRGADGEPVEVEWPAIVDRDRWYAVQAILTDPGRRMTPDRWSPLLLSGIATCADCGAPIQSGGTRRAAGGRLTHRYRCSVKAGHVYREAEPVDAYVEDLIVARLQRPDAERVFAPGNPTGPDVAAIRAEINELFGRMTNLAEGYALGSVPESAWRAGTDRARDRIEELERSLPTNRATAALAKLVEAPDVRAAWDALSLEERRSVARELVTVELVAPGTKERASMLVEGRKVANPETVRVGWR